MAANNIIDCSTNRSMAQAVFERIKDYETNAKTKTLKWKKINSMKQHIKQFSIFLDAGNAAAFPEPSVGAIDIWLAKYKITKHVFFQRVMVHN